MLGSAQIAAMPAGGYTFPMYWNDCPASVLSDHPMPEALYQTLRCCGSSMDGRYSNSVLYVGLLKSLKPTTTVS